MFFLLDLTALVEGRSENSEASTSGGPLCPSHLGLEAWACSWCHLVTSQGSSGLKGGEVSPGKGGGAGGAWSRVR